MVPRRHDYDEESRRRASVKAAPHETALHAHLGAWLTRAGRLAQAREVLQGGLASAERPSRLHHLLGLIVAGAGDYDAAQRHLERSVEMEPLRYEPLRDLALVQGAAGRLAASVETLRQAVALGGEGARSLRPLLAVGEKALAQSGGRVERRPPPVSRRAAVVERLVTREPELAEALVKNRADLTADQRETLRAARRTLARLAAQHPSYPDVHFGLSLISEQLGELDRAIESAEMALTLNPRYAEACLLAVRLYEKSGRTARAEEKCRRVIELRPTWADTHVRLGRLLLEQGRPKDAVGSFRRALDINGDCDEARRSLVALETAGTGQGGGA